MRISASNRGATIGGAPSRRHLQLCLQLAHGDLGSDWRATCLGTGPNRPALGRSGSGLGCPGLALRRRCGVFQSPWSTLRGGGLATAAALASPTKRRSAMRGVFAPTTMPPNFAGGIRHGCRAALTGKPWQRYSEGCWMRIERDLAGASKVVPARRRRNTLLERCLRRRTGSGAAVRAGRTIPPSCRCQVNRRGPKGGSECNPKRASSPSSGGPLAQVAAHKRTRDDENVEEHGKKLRVQGIGGSRGQTKVGQHG